MQIEVAQVTKLKISGAPGLDPIEVFLEDIGPAEGRITINCYTQSWVAYWGGMGVRTMAQFFCAMNENYLANRLSDCSPNIFDPEGLENAARKGILRLRRNHELDQDAARELYNDIEWVDFENPFHSSATHDLLHKVLGADWHYCLPTKTNPDYAYLCRIIGAVKQALNAIAVKAA